MFLLNIEESSEGRCRVGEVVSIFANDESYEGLARCQSENWKQQDEST